MAVEQQQQLHPASFDSSVFTYQPKISELSNKIAQTLQDDFLTRQQKHVEKQKHILEQALPASFRQTKASRNSRRRQKSFSLEVRDNTVGAENSDLETIEEHSEATENKNTSSPRTARKEDKVSQMVSSSPYTKDPIIVGKRRHQSKPDVQRSSLSKSIAATDGSFPRRERSASPNFVRPSRSRTMPSFSSSNKANREHASLTLDRLQRAQDMVQKAIVEKKIFCIAGTYYSLRESLRERGWVEKFCFQNGGTGVTSTDDRPKPKPEKLRGRPKTAESSDSDDDDPGFDDDDDDEDRNRIPPWEEDNGFYGTMSRMLRNHLPNFIFTTKMSSIDYKMLMKDVIVNHFAKNGCITTKNGLCVSLRNLPWYEPVDPNVFFPRCYKISTDDEKQEFIDDFRLSACQATVKWIIEKFISSKTRRSATPSARPLSVADRSSPAGDQAMPDSGVSSSNISPALPAPPTVPPVARAPSTKGPQIPAQFVDIAVEQCEKYLVEREHGFLDVLREPNTLTESQWNQFLVWYYQLVHQNGRLQAIGHSLDKLRSICERLEEAQPQFRLDGSKNMWIVKPGAKSRGRGVQCYTRLEDIIKLVSSQVIREGKYVVQKYIERPLLVYDTKFDIRQWFVVTDWNPLTMWFYTDSYLRFCSQLFSLDKMDESIHLSNNAIQCHYSNSKDRHLGLPDCNMWSSDRFKQYLSTELQEPNVWDEIIYPGMRSAVIWALEACQDVVASRKNSFELFGADFMLTDDFQPWLIEINCSPCMASSTPVTARLCQQVQEDLLKLIVDRRTDRHCSVGRFELAYRQPLVTAPNYLGLSLAIEGQNCGRRVRPAVSDPPVVSRQVLRLGRSRSVSDSDGSGDDSDSDSDSDSTNGRRRPTRRPSNAKRALQAAGRNRDSNVAQLRKSMPAALTRGSGGSKKSDWPNRRPRKVANKLKSRTDQDDALASRTLSIATCKIDPSMFEAEDTIFEVDGEDLTPDALRSQPDEEFEDDENDSTAANTASFALQPLNLMPFSFGRPKEERLELRVTGRPRRNAQLQQKPAEVVSVMTYHPPLPSRRPRPRAPFSYLPHHLFNGPTYLSNNTLETILKRARNSINNASEFAAAVAEADPAALWPSQVISSRSAQPPPFNSGRSEASPNKMHASAATAKSSARHVMLERDSRGSLFSPIRRVALSFQTHGGRRC